MDLIPPEIFYIVLSELPLSDVFNLKKICKAWLNIIDNYFLKKIVISKTGLPCHWRSFESYEKVNYLNLVIRNDLLSNEMSKKMFMNLKELCIYEKEIPLSMIAKINYLKNLERLDLFKLVLNEDCELNLLKLKTLNLYLRVAKTSRNQITLNMPCLENLKLNLFKHAKIIYQDKLIRAHSLGYDEKLKNLKNLKEIKIDALNYGDLEPDFLLRLDKLEKFDYEGNWQIFAEMKRQIEFYDRKSLEVYHFGVRYKNRPGFLIFHYDHKLNGRRVTYYLDRMSRLASELCTVHMIDFDEIFAFRSIPKKLLNKLIGIKSINASFSFNHNKVIESGIEDLLKHCNIISLNCYYLNQEFFDKLPYLAPFLNFINFGCNVSELDWNFLSNLKLLHNIRTNHIVKLDDLQNVLKNLTNLKCFKSNVEVALQSTSFEFKIIKDYHYEFCSFNLDSKKHLKTFKSRKEMFNYLLILLSV